MYYHILGSTSYGFGINRIFLFSCQIRAFQHKTIFVCYVKSFLYNLTNDVKNSFFDMSS